MNKLEAVKFEVKKAEKGHLITGHCNKRNVVERDCLSEFHEALGGLEQENEMILRYKDFNDGSEREKSMADGIIYTLIHQLQLGRVVLLEVLGVGTWRYKRVQNCKSKDLDYQHFNSIQVQA